MLKKFIGDKKFYKMVLGVALPIMLQNGITNFVSLLDNIMLGQVGTEPMSGAAIVNQLIFVFNLCLFGAVSGAGIFTAQFHGKGDDEGVRQTFRFKLIIAVILSAIAITLFSFFAEPLISLYLHEGDAEGDLVKTLGFGKEYIYVMIIGLLPFALSQAIGGTMRETEHTVAPMVAGMIAVVVNCVGNYILIFGHFGAPQLGVKGAAIATVISRFVEVFILIIYSLIKSDKFPFVKKALLKLFVIDRKLLWNVTKMSVILMVNETLWALGMSGLAWSYSTRGVSVVAAYNISSTIVNVFNIAYMALGNSVGIIVGKYLGAGENEKAVDVDRKLIAFSVAVGVVMGIIMVAASPLFPMMYKTSAEVKSIATGLLIVSGCILPMQSFLHACYFTLRSGGKTLITFLYDSGFMFGLTFPISVILANFTPLPIIPLYIACNSMELVKCAIGAIFLKKRIWINKIV